MTVLCHINDIEEGKSKGFAVNGEELFVVRMRDNYYVYRNHCPHMGINLEWLPDQFLDNDGCLIQCSMHGALFLIDSGLCIAGPCQNDHLTRLPFHIENEQIILD
ncbi:MAG: Rieske (2Fe-2S) protein [Venatoribacter sp.]